VANWKQYRLSDWLHSALSNLYTGIAQHIDIGSIQTECDTSQQSPLQIGSVPSVGASTMYSVSASLASGSIGAALLWPIKGCFYWRQTDITYRPISYTDRYCRSEWRWQFDVQLSEREAMSFSSSQQNWDRFL